MRRLIRQEEEQFYAAQRFNEPVVDPIGLAPKTVILLAD
jgi:hypothetical protein